MAVWWEIEHSALRIEGDLVVWTLKNVGDEDATPGSSLGTVSISRRGDPALVDTTPYTNALTLDRDVAAGTAHPMSYPLTWTGQEVGAYEVIVTPRDDHWAQLDFEKTSYGIERPGY